MKRSTLYIMYISIFIISLILIRQTSFVNKEEARSIALDIMHQKYSRSCGNNFTENIALHTTDPLNVSHIFGFDKSGYTFVSNNGKCEVTVYIYAYWGGYESFMEFNLIEPEEFNKSHPFY